MSDEFSRKTGKITTPAGPQPSSPASATQTMPGMGTVGPAPRARRASVVAPVRCRYDSILDFADTVSMNISRSGMFLTTDDPPPAGTKVDFELALADGFALLRGRGEIVRVSDSPAGIGIKFLELDDPSRKLIERIVDINTRENRRPTVAAELTDPDSVRDLRSLAGATPVSSGVVFVGRDLRVQLNPATVGYFVLNPLLNIRLGGFVVPAEEDVPLGTVFSVTLEDLAGGLLWQGKGKVVAKHEARLGIRLSDVDKPTLARLQAEVHKLSPSSKPAGG